MWIVSTYLGSLSDLYMEFVDRKQALNYKNLLIDLYNFDSDYLQVYYEEV